jgi:CDP-glycerol glycerophosphotransferase (TagB/SpsB family)
MLNARHLISSHADVPVIRPPEILRLAVPGWKYTFLQHGVIKDDLSGWLNPKPIDTFITSTRQEYDSIAGDENAYVFTGKEVQLTGLPRLDKLLRLGQSIPEHDRDLILVTPTWRQWLLPRAEKGSQRRTVHEDFLDSEFAQKWLALLRSPVLADLCREEGLRVGFLPHPNLQSTVLGLGLPDHVKVLSYDVPDVQVHFARAAVLVTDYSSTAFNAAYIERPVVYFQFDADRVLGGAHVGTQGYFSYEADGFGPVTTTVAEAEAAICDVTRAGRAPTPLYRRRIDATFPTRDGQCCRRVADAIVASDKRWQAPSR